MVPVRIAMALAKLRYAIMIAGFIGFQCCAYSAGTVLVLAQTQVPPSRGGLPAADDNTPRIVIPGTNVFIKIPQLIGIIAGCVVFTITIAVVFYLLYASGTWSGFLAEVRSGKPLDLKTALSQNGNKKAVHVAVLQLTDRPRLYDHLIEASRSLPDIPNIPFGGLVHRGREKPTVGVQLVSRLTEQQWQELFYSANGSAQYGESAYDPMRIWGWLLVNNNEVVNLGASQAIFTSYYKTALVNGVHLAITDAELQRQIGMISLIDNSPKNLSIRIDNIWITPAFQGKKRGHEAVMLVLQMLFAAGYRRIYCEVDTRSIVARKFLERCTFLMEGVIRKHKVVEECNRDTAVYVILNSDWDDHEIKLKRYLGWSLRPQLEKPAEIGAFAPIPNTRGGSNKDVPKGNKEGSKKKKQKK